MAAGVIASTGSIAADTSPAEDWQLKFVRRRYAKMIDILSSHLNEKALSEVLYDVGAYCATTDPKLLTYRGDFDGYCKHLKQQASGDTVTVRS